MRFKSLFLFIVLILLLIYHFSSCPIDARMRIYEDSFHKVTKIIDGDTFWVENKDGIAFKVRLIGVDAPETRKTPYKDLGYYGEEAKEYVKNQLEDQIVRLEFDVDSLDRYGRTLAYVYLEDHSFLNEDLLKQGYAKLMTVPPNVRYVDSFIRIEKTAVKQKRGLWKYEVKKHE